MITVGMMSRVSLGHTGRDIASPPRILCWIFILLQAGAVTRVLVPLFAATHYTLWIALSQACWIVAFSLLLLRYLPVWIQPRIDGKPG